MCGVLGSDTGEGTATIIHLSVCILEDWIERELYVSRSNYLNGLLWRPPKKYLIELHDNGNVKVTIYVGDVLLLYVL